MELRPSNSMKPILFNTEMVRAILGGRKTVTRRVVKLQEKILENPQFGYTAFTPKGYISVRGGWTDTEGRPRYGEKFIKMPYRPKDILYVRETFFEHRGHLHYKADGKYEALSKLGIQFKWRPSIHMPKETARIFLRVTDVMVERLQDIDDEGAKAEGANWRNGRQVGFEEKMRRSAVNRFAEIWNATLKPKDRAIYGWAANPWVWVIEFERISREEAQNEP